ncbi:tRNA pseudouridine(38-40) synthase TruA [Bacillus suaedae]|uniref:tRNA pseudouridine synthase A n=1 Tax=Halalkalibacter suaedae TaxID=2822140 RepID=A0A941AR22_9BACI|nr:tRNA pseudouridine(38-40) synthase TruA [Bacillus suaedae]MBP3953441.1 tRNA pseudouridine(38-40) synthase TruA [Bacillus suaedae]
MRIAILLTYEGTGFSGYQVQPGKRTVQGEIERGLLSLHKGQYVKVTSSGRTDAGVHARGQIIHFDTDLPIPAERWPHALNACLPNDIRAMKATPVNNEFHARYDAIGKEYRYRILIGRNGDVFRRNLTFQVTNPLAVDQMREASLVLLGEHDFSSFCAANTSVVDKVRTITDIVIKEEEDELVFIVRGNGFLYNMVRIIVGTLLEVGAGKKQVSEVREILEKKDRTKAGKTAPAQGLYLWKVHYKDVII